MQTYIAKRILLFIPTVFLMTIIVFLILRIVAGDPALMLVVGAGGDEGGETAFSQEALDAMRAKLGTDRPIYVEYGDWLWNMLHLDFGDSYFFGTSVVDDLKRALPITVELTILAVAMASVIAVPVGVLSAIRQDSWADYLGRIITITGIAIPNFAVAILLVFVLTRWFQWFPPLGYAQLWVDPWQNVQQLFFPAVALGFSNLAFIARVTRSAMLEVLREDYIRTARSKGLAEMVVVGRHALKNALLPVVTVMGIEFGRLLAGTVIIENIFLVPGIGRVLIQAIFQRDYPIVQAIVVTLVVIILVLNLAMDMVYGWLNPRIRYN